MSQDPAGIFNGSERVRKSQVEQVSRVVDDKSDRFTTRGTERNGTRMTRHAISATVLACILALLFVADSQAQNNSSSRTSERYRFKVTDGDSDVPIPHAAICLAYLLKQGGSEVRKEMESQTDQNGVAEFPNLNAYKLTISVTVKRYRSYWRWIRPADYKGPVRIRLEKWASVHR